jgi:tetratricopeptide (TPR) repeat protein
MVEKPLQVHLEVTDQHSGQFLLTFESSQYPITLNLEASIAFNEWLRRLRPVLEGEKDPAGSRDPQDLLRNVGIWLWQALLPASVPAQEREALEYALRSGHAPLLLVLPDILAGLPWELLYDPQFSGERGHLARRRPLMRLSTLKTTVVTPIELPLRVLLLISSPPSLGEDSQVDVESERAIVEQATHEMREVGLLHLLVEDIVTPKRVQQALIRFKPHVVHYIGHGRYNEEIGGLLVWEDEMGEELPFSDEKLAALLSPCNVHAVVLHACETGRSDPQMHVRGVAGTLIHEGIPAVLAQQAKFTYKSSPQASEAWYHALAAGQSFAEALFEVRQALAKASRPDWAVPILQGSIASLVPLCISTSQPGSPDPLLAIQGAAADLPNPTGGVFVGRHSELRKLCLTLENASGNGPVLTFITGPGGIGKSTLVAQAITRYGGKYKAALILYCQEYQSVDFFLHQIGEFLKRLGTPDFLEQCLPDPKLSSERKIEEAVVALNATGPLLLIIDNLESVQSDDQTIRDKGLLDLLQKLLTNLRSGRVLIMSRYWAKDLLPQGKFAANLQHLDLGDLSPYETNQLVMRHPPLARLSELVREKLVEEFGGLPYVYDLLSSKGATEDLERIIYEVRKYGTTEQKRPTTEQKRREEWQKIHSGIVEFATLETIIKRLEEPSQTLLAQLGVVLQPFPLALIEEGLLLDQKVWQPLLDWSLLHYDSHEHTYHLHSLTRHHAASLLTEESRKQAQLQLAAWYQYYARYESHDWMDMLKAQHLLRAAGNVQQAGELVIQISETLKRFGLYDRLHGLCIDTLADIGKSNKQLTAAMQDDLGYQLGMAVEVSYYKRLTISNEHLTAIIRHELGMIAQDRGRYEDAKQHYEKSQTIFKQLSDQKGPVAALPLHQLGMIDQGQQFLHGKAAVLHQLGMIAQIQGKNQEAQKFFDDSLAIDKSQGNQSGEAESLHQMGIFAQNQGDYQKAQQNFRRSLTIYEQLGDQSGCANAFFHLGIITHFRGNDQEAQDFFQRSLTIYERLGDLGKQAKALHELGIIVQNQKNYQKAQRLYHKSLNLKERVKDERGCANTLHQLGRLAYEQKNYLEAKQFFLQSQIIRKQLDDKRGLADTLHELGMIAQCQKNYPEAEQHYHSSLVIREQLGDKRGLATALHQLGTAAEEQGDFKKALEYAVQAYLLYEFLQSPNGKKTLNMLARIQDQVDETTFNACWQKYTLEYTQKYTQEK